MPGMQDRSIGSTNGAIETRLPPPMPSAFTFGMPSDASMQADMKELGREPHQWNKHVHSVHILCEVDWGPPRSGAGVGVGMLSAGDSLT